MKLTSLVAAMAVAGLAATAATADTIDFSQGASGVTSSGVSYTATDPGNGFSVLTQGSSWYGEFSSGAPVLFDNYVPGAVTFDFTSAIASLTGVGLQSNYFGAFTGTLSAYDAGGALVSQDVINFVSGYAPGTVPAWSVSGAGIVKVVASVTNDGDGFGIGPSSASVVPEPAAWTMMLVGVAAMGAMMRRTRKTVAVAA